MTSVTGASRGTTLVEVLVALGLVAVAMSTIASLAVPVMQAFGADPAAADAAQRGRGALLAVFEDLQQAGSGFLLAPEQGPGPALPAVWPDTAAVGPWIIGARPQVVSTWHARRAAAHAVLRLPALAGSAVLPLAAPALCPPSTPTCGFGPGDEVLLFGAHGRLALATVRQVLAPLDLEITVPLSETWSAGTFVSGVVAHTYEARPDPATGLLQVVRRLGAGPATPVADFVTRFDVTWWAGGTTPSVSAPAPGTEDDPTAGPAPPLPGTADAPGWLPGENCAFFRDAADLARWRGGPGAGGPAELPLGVLEDGPWCPSAAAAVRWDVDLVRVAEVRLVLAVAVASDALRTPASLGLRRPGARLVPDLVLEGAMRPGRRAGPVAP